MGNPTRLLRLAAFLLPLFAAGASAADKTHTWFRFTPTRLRDSAQPNSVQLSEFKFYRHGQALNLSQVIVANPGGNNPGTEIPAKLIDGDTATKWLDFNRRAVTFRFPGAVTIDSYSFTTANDSAERDPGNWRLEGSDDGTTWYLLDEIINGNVPTARQTATAVFPLNVTVPPYTSFWHPDYLLKWTPADDTSADFNRSYVPRATRAVNPALNVNSNARPNEGKVAVLTTFGSTSFQPSQGSAVEHFNAYTGWPYTDKLVFWGGSAGEGLILAPSAPVIDAAHRNGVPVLGNVFLPPTTYGGQLHWVRTFIQKNGSEFPVADKLIEVARHYGFDGWFLNQETAGTNSTDAANMRDFISYFRSRAPELEIMWYDAMNSGGGVGWQNALTASNEMYMKYNSQPVSHSMFLNFWWNSTMLADSRTRAVNLGIDPYSIYAGVDIESGGSNTNFDWNAVFPASQAHRLSLAFYGQQRVFQNSGNPAGFQNAELRFWTGANADPSNTNTADAWKGLAHYIPATSPLRQLPFVTNFNRGQGNRFAVDGTVLMSRGWNNLSLQDVLPTWRWIVSSTSANKLQPSLELDDAYYGGTSLKISGTLNGTNDVKLYAASLPVGTDTRFRIVYKTNQGLAANRMQVALAFEDAPTTFIYLNVGTPSTTGWNTATLNLGANAGKKIAVMGLRFLGSPAISDYQMRIGRIAIFNGTAPVAPAPATNLRVVKKDALDADTLAIRLKWDASTTANIHHYRIVQLLPGGTRRWLGGTPGPAFFIPSARRLSSESNITLEVTAVGADYGASSVATITVPIPGGPDVVNRLTGTWVGTPGSWNNAGDTGDKAFDGNFGTFFDAQETSAWTGLNFGAQRRITAFRYAPRGGWAWRMLEGGVFEAANQADFSDAVNLFTVVVEPPDGVFTTIPVSHPGLFRYFRFRSNGHGNVSEIQVYGYAAPITPAAPAASLSIGSAFVSWVATTWSSSYRIERSASTAGPFTVVEENNASTSFTDTTVPAGQRPWYRITSINPVGTSTPSTAAQAQPSSPYVAWYLDTFGSETSQAITGPQADPDLDGLPNLLEYAMGLPPFIRGAPNFASAYAANRVSITYTRNLAATDVPLTVQWTDSFQAWRTDGVTHETLSESNGVRVIRSSAPVGSVGQRFMRLQAVGP